MWKPALTSLSPTLNPAWELSCLAVEHTSPEERVGMGVFCSSSAHEMNSSMHQLAIWCQRWVFIRRVPGRIRLPEQGMGSQLEVYLFWSLGTPEVFLQWRTHHEDVLQRWSVLPVFPIAFSVWQSKLHWKSDISKYFVNLRKCPFWYL